MRSRRKTDCGSTLKIVVQSLPKGQFQSKESHEETLCVVHTPCSAGKYQEGAPSATRDRVCEVCPAGQFQNLSNHSETECVKCPKGTYLRDPSEDDSSKHDELGDCKDCTAKTYNPTMGLDRVCFPCSTQLVPGGTECDGCDPGKFKESNTAVQCASQVASVASQTSQNAMSARRCTAAERVS